jgi:hypothetical protein
VAIGDAILSKKKRSATAEFRNTERITEFFGISIEDFLRRFRQIG